MAEAILRFSGGDHFESLSAGSHPAGFIHPLAIEALAQLNVPLYPDQRSKSWEEFAGRRVDVVITLCDSAAALPCPVFAGANVRVNWLLPDPAYHVGTIEERVQFATSIARRLRAKVEGLVALDWSLDRAEIEKRLAFLAEI
jgi:arsenate reductase